MTPMACIRRLAMPAALAGAAGALANPVNPTVVQGAATFSQSGPALTVTNSANAVIHWQQFSIGSGELTRFVQPSAASAVLNRVTGQDPSQILGQLQSNGRVLLINPNGVLFGKDARIDVAGLVASTLNLSNDDFLAGRYRFSGSGANGVVNLGTITTPMGGNVYLVGGSVRNEGVITSPRGEVILAAGATVDLVDTATPNVKVEITAPAGEAVNLGSLLAAGGSIDIHAATVNQQGIVSADALARDDQGRIRLIASGAMTLGAKSVTSAANNAGGDGGFIETSGAAAHIEDGARISTAAPLGRPGTWLIDPTDFTIAASGGDLTGATLSASLGAGNVSILSSSGAAGTGGDIFVSDAVSWSANTLTLTAARDVNIYAAMTASGTAALALNPGTANGADSAVAGGSVKVGIDAAGAFMGRVDFPGRSGSGFLSVNGNAYTVIASLGAAGSTTGTDLQGISGAGGGLYALGANIDATPTSGWNAGAGFTPMALSGTFDGLGHTITGLTVNLPAPGTTSVGLFTTLGTVRNVGVINASIHGPTGCVPFCTGGGAGGILAASIGIGGSVSNSYTSGSITSTENVGGLVGRNNQGAIRASYSSASVTGTDSFTGGLAGFNSTSASISMSYSTGTVAGNYVTGGLVGESDGSISNSFSTGNVSGSMNNSVNRVGGIAGYNYGPIVNSYSTGAPTSGASTVVGGVLGENGNSGPNIGSMSGVYWDTTTSGKAICAGTGSTAGCSGLGTASMKQQASFTGWDFTNTWTITNGTTYPQLRLFLGSAPVAAPPPAAPAVPAAPVVAASAASTTTAPANVLQQLPDFLVQPLQQATATASVSSGEPLKQQASSPFVTYASAFGDPALPVFESCR